MKTVAGFLGSVLVAASVIAMLGQPLPDRLRAEQPWAAALTRALAQSATNAPRHPGIASLEAAQSAASVTLLGAGLLLFAWLRMNPTKLRLRRQVLVVALWSLPLLLVPPVLSRDMYSYADQGWMYLHGYDPYTVPMGTVVNPFQYGAGGWAGTTVVYPALSLVISGLMVLVGGGHWYWTIIAMRLPAVLGVALVALCAPVLARRVGVEPRRALWFGLANPLVVLHGVGGGHNDMLMAGLVCLALAVAVALGRRRHLWWALVVGGLLAGVATATKQPAALSVLAISGLVGGSWPVRAWPAHLVRTVVAGVASLASFFAISYGTGLGIGWIHGTGTPGSRITPVPGDLLFLILQRINFAFRTPLNGQLRQEFATVSLVIAVLLVAVTWWSWSRRQPLRFVVSGGLIWALLGGAIRPWYLLWSLPLFALARPDARARRVCVWFLVMMLVQGVFREYFLVRVLNAMLIGAAMGFVAVALMSRHPEDDPQQLEGGQNPEENSAAEAVVSRG